MQSRVSPLSSRIAKPKWALRSASSSLQGIVTPGTWRRADRAGEAPGGVAGADALGAVLDQDQLVPATQLLQRGQVTRVSEPVGGENRARARADQLLGIRRIEVEIAGADRLDQHRSG